jgi:hypothetical protein
MYVTKICLGQGTNRRSVRFRTMREDDDAVLVPSVAEDFVGRLGKDAVPYLRFEEALAADKGDALSAEAWHDLADAAALILACAERS